MRQWPSQKSSEIKKSPEECESALDVLLETLPSEIRESWLTKHDKLPIESQLSTLEAFIEKRRAAVTERADTSITEHPSHVQIEHSYPLAIERLIQSTEEGAHDVLGFGQAGRVVASVRNPDWCYKVMRPKEALPDGTNSVATEVDIQDEIYALGEVAGVRVPRVHMFIENERVRAIRMETVHGFTLKQLMSGEQAWPENFDIDAFFDALGAFIEHMHFNGYHHRDLHEGNVMVDTATGLPRVIDFGLSKRGNDYDNVYRQQVVKAGQIIELVLSSDLGSLARLKKDVQNAHPNMRGI